MFFLSVFSRLALAVFLLALSNKIESAPTHHLTIGVQGNTPTLMVTSSEIGITAQTMNFNKKPEKVRYATKSFKETEIPKKPLKTKFNKNQTLNNKKDKLQHLAKPQFKHELNARNLNKGKQTLEHKQNKNKKPASNGNVSFNNDEEKIHIQSTTDTSTSAKNVEMYKTNLQFTTLPPKQEINEMSLISSITTTAKSTEQISISLPPATTDTFSKHFATTDNDNLNISPAMSTTLSPKDFSNLNNNDDTNTATAKENLIQTQMQTATGANDGVLQTQKTTQISTETSLIKMANEDDNDRYKQESIAITDNENLLLTTIETNAFTTPTMPAEISTPSTVTYKINNEETTTIATATEMLALSLIMTTTENVVADDNNNGERQDEQQQQQPTEKSDEDINGRDKEEVKLIKQEYKKDKNLFKSRHEYMSTTIAMQQLQDEIKSTENPFKESIVASAKETILNVTKTTASENKIETAVNKPNETTTSEQSLATTENEQQTFTTFKANSEYPATSIMTETPEPTTAATTTETILKLIDLEKNADELKQPSVLMVAQHDNGHDGLKTTKKKQLIDKHYVEALLHQKQDHHQRKETQEDKTPLNVQAIFPTNSSKATRAGQKSILLPGEHGSLGPILMQEKIFHVMHQNANTKKVKKHMKDDTQSHLRRGHFVELKAKPAVDESKNYADIMPNKEMKIVTKVEDKIKEMHSDQWAENLSPLNVEVNDGNKHEQTTEDALSRMEDLDANKVTYFKNTAKEVKRKSGQDKNISTFQKSNPLKKAVNKLENSTAQNLLKIGLKEDDGKFKHDTSVEKILEISDEKSKPKSNERHQELSGKSSLNRATDEGNSKYMPGKNIELVAKLNQFNKSIETLDLKMQPMADEHLQQANRSAEEIQRSPNLEKALDTSSELSEESLHGNQPTTDKQHHHKIAETFLSNENNKYFKVPKITKETQNSGLSKKAIDRLPESSALKLKQQPSAKHQQTELKSSSKSSFSEDNEDDDTFLNATNSEKVYSVNKAVGSAEQEHFATSKDSNSKQQLLPPEKLQLNELKTKPAAVLSTTVFQVMDTMATKTPLAQADTIFSAPEKSPSPAKTQSDTQQTESKISDIQIEIYDSTIDSIVSSTNFKDNENKQQISLQQIDENNLGKTTKPPIAAMQQERFTQYVIDRTETSTPEPINYNTIKVASGKPEPAAIEIHINVSESFGNESEDLEFSYPQSEFANNQQNEKIGEDAYDENKVGDNTSIKLQIPSNSNNNGKDLRNDEILVVEIIDTENNTAERSLQGKTKMADELFISDVKHIYSTPPPPPPPPPFQTNFDRDSDTIFYISNTEVKVGESPSFAKNVNEDRKLKLESQFFPANYMASTQPNLNNNEDRNLKANHHLFEEDIILSSNRNQADSLKIYRNDNEPAPPLDVTYVGESIIEVEQSPDIVLTTTYAPEQIHNMATPQADVIIQPAILPEISIGVPVIGELPPQIELKEIDFMPNEAQLHRSGIYDDNDNSNNNDIDDNTITGSSNYNNKNNHDADIVSGNSNSNQHIDESSIQYGGDLIDESADGGFDGVEGSYPFGNPALVKKSSFANNFFTKLQKHQPQQQQKPNHVADYAHLYVNYGVNNMRKDELTADVKDSGEMFSNGNVGNGNVNINTGSSEQNTTAFKDFLGKVSMSNSTMSFATANATQNERISNATAFSVMEGANDLEDRNTENIINLISLAIGLFIVILPVVVTCSMFWALRYLYKKYHTNLTENAGYADQNERKIPLNENGAEKSEFVHEPSSSPTNSHKDTLEKYPVTSNKPSITNSSVKFSSEKPIPYYIETSSCNTNASLTANYPSAIASKKNEASKLSLALSSPITQKHAKPLPTASSPPSKASSSEHTHDEHDDDIVSEERDDDDVEMPGPNGSITKMTLENNLLIVETEERNDISRVARETKMDYNKDGVFVVEVARGIDSKTIPESPVSEGNEKILSMFDAKQNNGGLGYKIANEKNCNNNEKVQIHSPPPENQEEGPRSLHQIEEVEEPINSPHLNDSNVGVVGLSYKANTGLSQSDLSTTSSSDSNKGYCYGNQELYVVEQKGYSTVAPNGNVVLKCDIKDIHDDDRNPGNDHYLKHSPDRKEDQNKDKEDDVKTSKSSKQGENRTSSGESPEQKQNDKIQAKNEINVSNEHQTKTSNKLLEKSPTKERSIEISPEILETKKQTGIEACVDLNTKTEKVSIPVEIEVHIIPASVENSTENETLPSYQAAMEQDSSLLEDIESVPQPLIPENFREVLDNSLTDEQNNLLVEEQDSFTSNESEFSIQFDKNSNNDDGQVHVISSEIEKEKEKCEFLNKADQDPNKDNAVAEGTKDQSEEKLKTTQQKPQEEEPLEISVNSSEINGFLEDKHCQTDVAVVNGFVANDKTIDHRTILEEQKESLNSEVNIIEEDFSNAKLQSDIIKNTINGFAGTAAEPNEQELQNGHADTQYKSISLHDIENSYDSILNLPEPPPTTDEQINSDLSEQQLDSLPPPPPPEVFSHKDLPPPLTNGNVDSPQSEESNSFYNTLPPPPPTTLEVTVSAGTTTTTNGKVHVSPLTPPASPPAHFTNNIHAGLCSQPIAVDVNGS